jgi:hypothetical protein
MLCMTIQKGAGAAALVLTAFLAAGCTGGTESNAATEEQQQQAAKAAAAEAKKTDVRGELGQINEAIPVYAGAEYRDDLTKRDEVMIRNQYGQDAQVYTLASDDSFPQVYHYYTTYLAQFGGFSYNDRYPSSRDNWRTLQVQLNQAMQEPFVPGTTLALNGKQVILQLVETEAEPKTVIRYIVTPPGTGTPAPVATASAGVDPQQSVAR